jgi:HK97 gp10 family phage protein
MPFSMNVGLRGSKALRAKLAGLSAGLARGVLQKAGETAARVMLERARANAPRETNLLRESLGSEVALDEKAPRVKAIVGPRKGFERIVTRSKGKWGRATAKSNPVMYAHLLERGTTHAQKRPFLAPALQSARAAGRRAFEAALKKAIGGATS